MDCSNATTNATATQAARFWVAVFGVTIFLGAFLLFQVQPLVSKAILPWFGGCPAVWTTCMLFFQTLLFAGYLYAHLLQRWLGTRNQVVIQLLVAAAALTVLPILPGADWKPAADSNPTCHILLLLAATVGLPYFALSATSPLVQAWFNIRFPGRSPYRLYALSNVGSLTALLTYPFLFEPAFDLPKQATLWSVAFAIYVALCVANLACLWNYRRHALNTVSDEPDRVPTATNRICWLLLPACASLMLLAGTNYICQDVAAVPFLWVMPLSLYLLSFIICFDHDRWYIRPLWAAAVVVTLTTVAVNDYVRFTQSLGLVPELTLNLAAVFFACMTCHGELARLKPGPRHLTEFYLVIAAGGALGGVLVAVVAPLVFSKYLEWQIGIAMSLLLAIGLLILPQLVGRRGIIYYALLSPIAGAIVSYLFFWGFDAEPPIDRARNFFGVVTVKDYGTAGYARHERLLVHGRITHGCQPRDPAKRRWPTSYYGEESGVGLAIRYLQKSGPIRVGAVGLGIGTISTYARPGDLFRFYEINTEVLRMARQHFTYLDDCRGKCEIVLGDARLSLDAQPPQRFNLLVLDAFSSDSIPTHLLTREAMAVYMKHLEPDGAIAIHISNRYLDLAPVVRGLAEDSGLKVVQICSTGDDDKFTDTSDWMLLTRNDALLQACPGEDQPETSDSMPLWTDQYNNLFQILTSH
jgi:hypothetical protein